MTGKTTHYGEDLQKAVLAGVEELAKAVSCTLGPKGRNVIIPASIEGAVPHITKDGVTVAKSISFSDEMKNAGAALVKDVASRVVEEAGDGTTTSVVLAARLIKDGYKYVNLGYSSVLLKRGMDIAVNDIVGEIKKFARPIGEDIDKIRNVATLSANNDPEIGNIIAEAMQSVGKDGIITVETGTGVGEMRIRKTEGMMFDKGWLAPIFVTDADKMEASYQNPNILIVDDNINSSRDILEILRWSLEQNRPLVIIANDVAGDALQALLLNRMRSNVAVLPIKAPMFGDNRTEKLEDIAVMTGGIVVSPKAGMKLASFDPAWLGTCEKITAGKDSTLILNGKGDPEMIEAKASLIRNQIAECEDEWDREQLQKRLAALTGGAAVIEVNAISEVEMKEKKDRVDDALAATRAAIQEGIVDGGGCTFVWIAENLKRDYENDLPMDFEDMKQGYFLVINALYEPLKTICKNAGVNADSVLEMVSGKANPNGIMEDGLIYDALTNSYLTDNSKIIDPAKVLRSAIENAVSVASTLITTECIVVNEPVESSK